jgi:hypothetical protein
MDWKCWNSFVSLYKGKMIKKVVKQDCIPDEYLEQHVYKRIGLTRSLSSVCNSLSLV